MKKGIPARQLRPYSMEDPFGLGIESPSQKKLRERFHRKFDRKRPLGRTPPAHTGGARPTQREPRKAPVAPTPAPQPTPKKRSGCGCLVALVALVILGVLWAVGQIVVPLIVDAVQQELVLQTGNRAHGRILKAQATDIHVNESTIYELTVEVHLPQQPVYQVEFKQALDEAQAAQARPGAWTTLRYNEKDRNSIVLERLGVEPPNEETSPAATKSTTRPSDDQFLKVDIRATATVSTDTPSADTPPTQNKPATSATSDSSTPQSKTPHAAATRAPSPGAPKSTGSSATGTLAPSAAGAPRSEPAPSPNGASTQEAAAAPSQTVLPICRRAAACCTLAGGASCGQFVTPGKEKRECSRAYGTFKKQAAALDKACQ